MIGGNFGLYDVRNHVAVPVSVGTQVPDVPL